jgi:hypothetical protein
LERKEMKEVRTLLGMKQIARSKDKRERKNN